MTRETLALALPLVSCSLAWAGPQTSGPAAGPVRTAGAPGAAAAPEVQAPLAPTTLSILDPRSGKTVTIEMPAVSGESSLDPLLSTLRELEREEASRESAPAQAANASDARRDSRNAGLTALEEAASLPAADAGETFDHSKRRGAAPEAQAFGDGLPRAAQTFKAADAISAEATGPRNDVENIAVLPRRVVSDEAAPRDNRFKAVLSLVWGLALAVATAAPYALGGSVLDVLFGAALALGAASGLAKLARRSSPLDRAFAGLGLHLIFAASAIYLSFAGGATGLAGTASLAMIMNLVGIGDKSTTAAARISRGALASLAVLLPAAALATLHPAALALVVPVWILTPIAGLVAASAALYEVRRSPAAPEAPAPGMPSTAASAAWDKAMAAVEEAASASRQLGANPLQRILKDSVDGVIAEYTEKAKTATRGGVASGDPSSANEMSRRLDSLIRTTRSIEQQRKLQALKTALDDFDAGRTASVVIDPVSYKDHPYDALGLADANVSMQQRVTAAFARAMDEGLSALDDAGRLAALRAVARYKLPVPQALYSKLVANNEYSTFSGNMGAYAVDRLAAMGTPEALAEAALLADTNARISDESMFILSNKAQTAIIDADRGVAREAVDRALAIAKQPLYADRDASRRDDLRKKLLELRKAVYRTGV